MKFKSFYSAWPVRTTGILIGISLGAPSSIAAERVLCEGIKVSPALNPYIGVDTPVLLSESMRIRRAPKSRAEKFEAEFGVSLALIKSQIVHPAYQALSLTLPEAGALKTPAVNEAMKCFVDFHRYYPTLEVPEALIRNLGDFPGSKARDQITILSTLRQIRKRAPQKEIQRLVDLVAPKTAEGELVRALQQSYIKKVKNTLDHSENFLVLFKNDSFLSRYETSAHALAARAAFQIGDYERAIKHFQSVPKSSNFLADSLSELAWAFLKAEKFPEAIGTAIHLQSGGLKRTFAPEAPMVMAMALNEVCQFPEAIKAVKVFQGQYATSYEWLKKNAKQDEREFYKQMLDFVRRQSVIPDKVAGEWIRTPEFISRQEEINLFAKERANIARFEELAKLISARMGHDLIKQVGEVKKRLKSAKNNTEAVMADLDRLRNNIDRYIALKRTAPIWRALAKAHQMREPARKAKLVAEINRFAKVRSQEMYVQLNEIAENIQLIEAELYSGAAKDLVWQNAQPDVKERAKEFLEQQKSRRPADAWYWGHADHGLAGTEEIWEDELGSFKVDIVDYCELRDAPRPGPGGTGK